ncbi:MAG: methylmalonyl-CoA carboxyltransferase [Clostridiales bacterium]|nr:methylmalonyl-CoA carboxyltransferase [Clostridiales bacterium]
MISNAPDVLKLKEQLLKGGGTQKVEEQHNAGKMTARERIEKVIDQDTFIEIDAFLTFRNNDFTSDSAPCEGLVAGYGTINNRPVYIYAQDYTVLDGSVSEMNAKKICKTMDMAASSSVPIIGILDSAGARIQESVDALNGYGSIFNKCVQLSGIVPQINLICGPCIGAAAIAASLGDITLIAEEIGATGAYSASVYDAKDSKDSASDITSASYVTTKSGLAAIMCKTEDELFAKTKELLEFLPSSNLEDAPDAEITDDLNRNTPEFDSLIGTSQYDVVQVIQSLSENSNFLELYSNYATTSVVGFMRINSRAIGVVANQPNNENGIIKSDSAKKIASFIGFCDSFSIPLLTLVDSKGIESSSTAEHLGIVKDSAKIAYAYSSATIPMVTVILNNATGSAYSLMGSRALGADIVYAWPSAKISILPADVAAMIVYKDEIEKATDPIKARKEYTDKFSTYNSSPIAAAQRGYIDDIIDPINTRPMVAAAFEMLYAKYSELPPKKHGNMPL